MTTICKISMITSNCSDVTRWKELLKMLLYFLTYILQRVLRAALGLTTAVTHAVHTVLVATVITLTAPVPGDVNQDMTFNRVSFAIQVR